MVRFSAVWRLDSARRRAPLRGQRGVDPAAAIEALIGFGQVVRRPQLDAADHAVQLLDAETIRTGMWRVDSVPSWRPASRSHRARHEDVQQHHVDHTGMRGQHRPGPRDRSPPAVHPGPASRACVPGSSVDRTVVDNQRVPRDHSADTCWSQAPMASAAASHSAPASSRVSRADASSVPAAWPSPARAPRRRGASRQPWRWTT